MACHIRDKGVSHQIIRLSIESINRDRCEPPLTEAEVQKLLDSALGYAPRPSWQPKLSEGSVLVHKFLVDTAAANGKEYCSVTEKEIADATGIVNVTSAVVSVN